MKKIKLIWDFYGMDAEKTAEHHEKHLNDYAKKDTNILKTGYEKINEHHCLAYLIVEEKNMLPVRDLLKPMRGTLFLE